MRRYLILAFLFCLTLPFDFAVTGCTRNPAANFCDNLGYGARNSSIATIVLNPSTTGLSLPYGEVGNTQTPVAHSCAPGSPTVSVGTYDWGTSDLTIADINPNTGQICAGSWNRTTAGGVAAYTTCLPTGKTGVAYITASAGNVTSNVVPVYVHPAIASVSLTATPQIAPANGSTCISQGQSASLDITAYATGATTALCAPPPANGTAATVPDCSGVLGALTYAPVTPNIVTIGTAAGTTNLATANQPGSTEITVTTNTGSTSGGTTTSSAGYFYTCPPKSIALTANGSTTANVTPNNPQAITATVTDTNNNVITGLALTYASTQPTNVPVSTTGSITSVFPSTASVTAICQPPTCNPAPINQIGVNGNGTPTVSNPLLVNASGVSSSVLYMASPKSQYYSTIDFTVGNVSAPVKLPYFPNSMVLSPTGTNIFFGSYHELMVASATSNSISKEDPTAPGVVLAASPDGTTLLINDQNRAVFYLYSNATNTTGTKTGTSTSTSSTSTATTGGVITTFGGLGQRAQFSSDSQTVYITGNDPTTGNPTLFVHNVFTGWNKIALTGGVGEGTTLPATSITSACPANLTAGNVPPAQLGSSTDANTQYNTFCGPDLAVAVPSVGPFISGAPATGSFGFCPAASTTPVDYYPTAGTLAASTQHLVATTDSQHVIGASTVPSPQLTDSNIVIPTGGCPETAGAPPVSTGFTITNSGNNAIPLTGYNIANIDQVAISPNSALAIVTYNSSATSTPPGGALLPVYKIPASGTAGTVAPVTLSGSAIAPIAGIISPDSSTIYAATSGDNLVHLISTASLTDASTISPGLPDASGNITPAQFLAVRPRSRP